jgi:hypothetical protein
MAPLLGTTTSQLWRNATPGAGAIHTINRERFPKLKALLRAKAERTIDALWSTVGLLIDLFTPNECANYFRAAGYEPD